MGKRKKKPRLRPSLLLAIARVRLAHDSLSEAAEDPDGDNDAEHDAAVRLMEELNGFYAELIR